jgi:uncharacterized membrane protein
MLTLAYQSNKLDGSKIIKEKSVIEIKVLILVVGRVVGSVIVLVYEVVLFIYWVMANV